MGYYNHILADARLLPSVNSFGVVMFNVTNDDWIIPKDIWHLEKDLCTL